jgi:hypothetical protein
MTSTRDELNAFLDLPEVPVPHAQSGALSGLSLGVKEIFDVAGYVTGPAKPHHAQEGRHPRRWHANRRRRADPRPFRPSDERIEDDQEIYRPLRLRRGDIRIR